MNKKEEIKELRQESSRKTEMLNKLMYEVIRLNKVIKKNKKVKQ